MLELLCHAPDRATFWQDLADSDFVSLYDANDNIVSTFDPAGYVAPKVGTIADSPVPGMHELNGTPMMGWVELGDQVKTPAVFDGDGNELTPAVMYGLYFVNLRGWGTFEAAMLAGHEQYEADGETLKWIFDRTNLLFQYPTLIQYSLDTAGGTPRGYSNDNGVCFYDSADISTRANVWA